MADDFVPIVNVISFAQARERAEITEGRLFHLMRRGVLVKRGEGLDAEMFSAAMKHQETVRSNPNPCWMFGGSNVLRGQDAATKLLLAFGPGFLDVLVVDVSAERLPGVDYDSAIERAIEDVIHANQNDQLRLRTTGAAKAVEAVIWARFGDPAAMRLDAIRTVASAILAGWARLQSGDRRPTGAATRTTGDRSSDYIELARGARSGHTNRGPELGRWKFSSATAGFSTPTKAVELVRPCNSGRTGFGGSNRGRWRRQRLARRDHRPVR